MKKKETDSKNIEDITISLLQESVLSDIYDNLSQDDEGEPIDTNLVDGIIDNILVVTDPDINEEGYQEVIERAKEVIEDTPEGEIPFDEDYLGEFVQTCPICGGTFVTEKILEPGATCPLCYDTPEAFVMVGQLSNEEDSIEDETNSVNTEEPIEEPVEDIIKDKEELNASEEIKTSDSKLEESTNNYNFEDIVMSSYNHLKNDLGKNPSEDDIFDDIIHNYEQNFISDKSPENSSNAIKSIRYVLDQNNVEAIADSQQETIKEESKNNCNFEVGFYTYNDTNVASMFLRCNETNKGCWAYINLDDNDNIVNIEYPQVDTPMFNEDPEFMSFINTLQTDCKDKVMKFAKDVVSKTASYRKNYTPKEEKPAFDISKYNTVDEIDKRLSEIDKQFAYIKRRDKVSLALDGDQEKADLRAERTALRNKLNDLLNKSFSKEESVSLEEEVEYISKAEFDKMPKDYKSTVGNAIKAAEFRGEDPEAVRKLYKNLGYDESDPMILALEKGGTVLKPVKIKNETMYRITHSISGKTESATMDIVANSKIEAVNKFKMNESNKFRSENIIKAELITECVETESKKVESITENEIIQLHNSIEAANDADEIQELIYTISDGTLEDLVQQAYDASIQDGDELDVLKDFVIATLEDNAEYGEPIEESKLQEDKFFNLYNAFDKLYGISKYNPEELIKFLDALKEKERIADKDYDIMVDFANKYRQLINATGYNSEYGETELTESAEEDSGRVYYDSLKKELDRVNSQIENSHPSNDISNLEQKKQYVLDQINELETNYPELKTK